MTSRDSLDERKSIDKYSDRSASTHDDQRESKSTYKSHNNSQLSAKFKRNGSEGSNAEDRLREFQDVTKGGSSSTKHVFLFLVLFLLFGLISLQAIAVVAAWRESFLALLGHSLLCLAAGSTTMWSLSLCFSCFKRRRTQAEEADYTLLYLAVVTPLVLIVARLNPLPSSDDSKVNCVITYAFLLRLGSLMDLSPAHSMVQVVLSFPLFT